MTGVKRVEATNGLRTSSPLREDGDQEMSSPDKKRIRSSSEDGSDSDESYVEDPNSDTMIQINEMANDLSQDALKLADFMMARLSARDKVRDERMSKVGKDLRSSVKRIEDAVSEAVGKADEALAVAHSAKSTADEALGVAVSVRDRAAHELSDIRKEVAEQGKKIQALQQGREISRVPGFSKRNAPGDRVLQMNADFDSLLAKTAAMKSYFVMGTKKDWHSEPTVETAKTFLAFTFPGMPISVSQPPNAKFVRLHVDREEDAATLALAIESRWPEFAEAGWWMREEAPSELRALENRARAFIIEAKDSDSTRKKQIGYVAVKHGKIVKDGREVLPLCHIPVKKGDNWKALFPVFGDRVASLGGQDWLGQFEGDDTAFYLKWFKAAGLHHLVQDYKALASVKKTSL